MCSELMPFCGSRAFYGTSFLWGDPIHERFLRYVWTRGLFRSSGLRTTDGRALTILAPGRLVDGAGPDVRDAVIKIGPTTFAGDVEFHQDSVGWTQHDHHLRPSYNRVILHVVFNGSRRHRSAITKSRRTVPLLVLLPYLSAPVNTLWDSFLQDERTAASLACFGMNRNVPQNEIEHWLHRMDIERLELRILRLQERLRELVAESTQKLAEPLRNYGSPREEGFPEEIPAPYPELSRGVLADRRLWCRGYLKVAIDVTDLESPQLIEVQSPAVAPGDFLAREQSGDYVTPWVKMRRDLHLKWRLTFEFCTKTGNRVTWSDITFGEFSQNSPARGNSYSRFFLTSCHLSISSITLIIAGVSPAFFFFTHSAKSS